MVESRVADDFDFVVIGAGSAGLPAAGFAARLGARTALVEAERVGGDCTWTGCVPSKALLHAARVAHLMHTLSRVGLTAVRPEVDLGAVMSRVRQAGQRGNVRPLQSRGHDSPPPPPLP